MENEEILEKLKAPFETVGADGKTYPDHKWKMQTNGGVCVPYIDSVQVVNRLNDVLGIDGWGNTLIEMSGKGLICEITATIGDKEVTKSNIGVETSIEAQKGQASDALKRAAVNFGVGAYLKDVGSVFMKTTKVGNKTYPVTDKGIALKTGDALSSYINMKNPFRAKLTEIYRSISEADQKLIEKEFTAIWKVLTK